MGKLTVLIGGGIGYVLGARAGRERYEQIERQARRVWKDPRVEQKKAESQEAARSAATQLKDKAAEAAPDSVSGSGSGRAPQGGSA